MQSRLLAVLVFLPLYATVLGAQSRAVDHAPYDALLRRHVVAGLVDYDAFAGDASFTTYLESMNKVDPSLLSSNDRLAYWINMYNAWTIRLVTSHNERESIRNINRTLGVLKLKGPWTEPLVKAAGRTMSLDQVQYEMIRRESSDPRIHFALSCAAVSCAPLRSEAYTGERLESQLHDQGRVFLTTDSTRNHFDVKSRTFRRNILFRHFRNDFGETRREFASFLAQWLNDTTTMQLEKFMVMQIRGSRDTSRIAAVAPDSASRFERVSMESLLKSGTYRVEDLPFNWSLNSIARRSGAKQP